MRPIRRDRRYRRTTRARATSADVVRRLLVAVPGVVLAVVVAAAIAAPGFGVAVTGGSLPPPPDLGGPILLPAGVSASPSPPSAMPVPTEPAPRVESDLDAATRRWLAAMVESGRLTPGAEGFAGLTGVPAVTYRPLPAAVPSAAPAQAAEPEQIPRDEPAPAEVPSAPAPMPPSRATPAPSPMR
ncbi:hypothetical protein MXD62_21835 [Frankia sp. Mgl5]|uniref:hypothetical protein n=1 Tax=Frankia sp. Mgl5 TaxID=2933793 RepID=UPI00200E6007|nr:hypothetical protein [Frankia sp. Mgl5]MCK9929779.1 hypothetical protein [Frankia sp. Mgl5]